VPGPGDPRLGHEILPEAHLARPRPRLYFNPVTGWFRRFERAANQFLSHRVFSKVSWIDWPYAAQLDRRLTVSEAEIPIPSLPLPFDGVRVLLITDIHTGPFLRLSGLERTFDRLGSLGADMILLGGDLTTSRVDDFRMAAEAYARLSAPLGVYAVLGNHDHYTEDPALLRSLIEATGIDVLHNRSVVLERAGARLILAGIDDLNAGRPDLDAALAESGEGSADPVVLLSHNPDVLFDASRRGVSLVLSGHTHGGQIRIPGLPVLVRMSRFCLDEGRYFTNGAELVVSRGLGASGFPLRLACSPEVVLVTLRRG